MNDITDNSSFFKLTDCYLKQFVIFNANRILLQTIPPFLSLLSVITYNLAILKLTDRYYRQIGISKANSIFYRQFGFFKANRVL